MESKLREELEWYTMYASDEEYDWKAVESILYLLDRWEPLEEGTVPPVEESWKRFMMIADRKELLPVEDPDVVLNAARKKAAAGQEAEQGEAVTARQEAEQGEAVTARQEEQGDVMTAGQEAVQGKTAAVVQTAEQRKEEAAVQTAGQGKAKIAVQTAGQGEEKDAEQADIAETYRILEMRNPGVERDAVAVCGSCVTGQMEKDTEEKTESEKAEAEQAEPAFAGKAVRSGKIGKLAHFASRHKIVAAAVLVLVVLMVGNTVHVVANPEAGFFFWMKRDDSGITMITSPEGLDDAIDRTENIFYNKDDAPEWAQDWLQIEEKIEMPQNYEWQHFEVNELPNRKEIVGKYWNNTIEKEIVLGVWIYAGKIAYYKEEFVGYDYLQGYEINQKQMDIYSREETDGVYYIVCFYNDNCQYYVRGHENLDELKQIIEQCWMCINES